VDRIATAVGASSAACQRQNTVLVTSIVSIRRNRYNSRPRLREGRLLTGKKGAGMAVRRWCLKVAVVVVGGLAVGAPGAAASTITVANGADSGPGSLRAAIAAAGVGDTISIPALTVGLTSGQLVVNHSLTITGAGARATTISGSSLSRVFEIASGTVSISGVTITGGTGTDTPGGTAGSGGGIDSGGTLTLTDSTVTGNQVQGTNEGGGIQSSGTLTVVRSTISYNSALGSDRAGGIGDAGPITIINTTLAHNTLQTGGLGAGLYVNTGSTTLTNDLFDLNAAGPSGTQLDLNYESQPSSIANTIVLGAGGGSCSRMPATNPSVGGNIEDQASCEFTRAGDHQNAVLAAGPLQDHGGPTDTQLPSAGSLALDAGNDSACPATDQRGVPRPQGPHCDVGPVELTTPSTDTPSVSSISSTGATLTTTVNPEYVGGSYSYSYGATTAYGTATPAQPLADGTASQPAAASLSGLTPATTYHVKLVLTSPDGTASSSDVTFTTLASPPPPTSSPPKPVISHGHVTHNRFRVGKQATAISARTRKAPVGTAFTFTLSTAAKMAITIVRNTPGLRSGPRCVVPTVTLKHHHAKRCIRTITAGTLTRSHEPAGADRVVFSGRIGHVPLVPGSYKARLLATNSTGRSNELTLSFTVVT
jgi:hypothetical protein